MGSSTNFTEWLIQTGIVRSDQYCSLHVNTDMSPVKLKLGMYSDVSKFPYSGGYVWISECCPQRFVSVSVFFRQEDVLGYTLTDKDFYPILSP